MDKQAFGRRLEQLMKDYDVSNYKLAKDLTISKTTVSNYISGDTKPNSTIIDQICLYFRVNKDWIIYGEGEKYAVDIEHIIPRLNVISPQPIKSTEDETFNNKNGNQFLELPNGQFYMLMPLAEFKIQAGLLSHYQDADFLMELGQHGILVDKAVQGRYVAFRVSGDSMDDGSSEAIPRNSIVATRELQRHLWTSKLRYKDFPYWVIYSTQSKMPLLKEITEHNVEEGYIVCHSLNDSPEFQDFKLNMNDVQALFYVIEKTTTISKKVSY